MTLPVRRTPDALGRWDPFREFDDLYGRLGRWMDDVFGRGTAEGGAWSPTADLSETDEAFVVTVDLPGVAREDIEIEVSGRELRIHGETKEPESEGVVRYRARRFGSFDHRLTLPQEVAADRVEAKLADGVLTVRVPKSEETKPRRVEITPG